MLDAEGDLPLDASRRKRLYEPIILLDALRSVYRKDNSIIEPDLQAAAGKSPQQIYFCFLNKLSQICDNQPHQWLGRSVTAFVVLDSGTNEYRFACNQRDRNELNTVRAYVTDILNILGGVTEDEMNDKAFMASISSHILLRILAFNRRRIEGYIESLCEKDRLAFCIESSTGDGTNEGNAVSRALASLQPHIEAASNVSSDNNDEFARHAKALIHTIKAHYQPSLEGYMKRKTRGDNTISDSPWSHVRHALGRLLSYFIAVKVLLSTLELWPQLFVDFEVNWIPSSTPSADPPDIRRNAKGIINRMGRNKDTINAYQSHAQKLQGLGLDDYIKKKVHHTNFQPIVHAETALLHSVLHSRATADSSGDDPIRFFNEADFGGYIGSSKPTCLLCHLYFAAHPSGIQCRGTHGNLYRNWRPPSVSLADGAEAKLERDMILEEMIKGVRNEAVRAIKERSYTRRVHDSRDTPSDPTWSTTRATLGRGGGSVVAEGNAGIWEEEREALALAERLGQVNLDAGTASVRRGSGGSSRTVTATAADPRRRYDSHSSDSGGEEVDGDDTKRDVGLAPRFGQSNRNIQVVLREDIPEVPRPRSLGLESGDEKDDEVDDEGGGARL